MIGFGTRYERGTGREEARGNFVTHMHRYSYTPQLYTNIQDQEGMCSCNRFQPPVGALTIQ